MDLLVEAELKRALAAAGCPLCRAGEDGVERYLRFILHEFVNDPATRSRLAEAWGFCRRHAWHFLRLEWATMRDGLSTAVISEALVKSAEEVLDGYLRDAAPAARGKRRMRARLEKLLRALTPTGVCPACDLQARHEAYTLRLRELLTDLEEYIRKHDYRFSHEPYRQERDAMVRGTAALAGSWFDLPHPPQAGGGKEAERVEAGEEESHG